MQMEGGRRATTSTRPRSLPVRSWRGAAASCLRPRGTTRSCLGPPRPSRRTSPRWQPPLALRPPMTARSVLPTLDSTRPCAAIDGHSRGSRRRSPGSRRAATSLFSLPNRLRLCPGERRDCSRRGCGRLRGRPCEAPAAGGDRGPTDGRADAARRGFGARARAAPVGPHGSALVGGEVRARAVAPAVRRREAAGRNSRLTDALTAREFAARSALTRAGSILTTSRCGLPEAAPPVARRCVATGTR